MTRTPLSRSKGQRSPGRFTHRGLTRQAAAAVSVGTYWVWETTATLWCARRREGLGGASAPTEGGKGCMGEYRGGRPPVYFDDFSMASDTVVTKFTPKVVISTARNTLLLDWWCTVPQ